MVADPSSSFEVGSNGGNAPGVGAAGVDAPAALIDPALPPAADATPARRRNVAAEAGRVSIATMASRVLGLAREQVMAGIFGAGLATDAFNVAFRVPNLLRDLFAEGALSAAFVPTFTETDHRKGRAEAWRLGAQVMNALAVALALVTIVGWLITPWLVPLLAPGFGKIPGKLELTILLSRLMLPFLLIVALAAAAMGMLNALRRFTVPALAPLFLNLGMIVGGLALIPVFKAMGQPPILAMAAGVLIGGTLQLLVQVPLLFKLGFRPAWPPALTHPGVRRIAFLMLPATIGLAATQLNIFVNTILASTLEQGSVSWLSYAFRLMQLPIGVFGVALATVSLPTVARQAVEGDMDALRSTVSGAIRLVFALTLPATFGLWALSVPLVRLLYQHGHFHTWDTNATAAALSAYCIGLCAYSAVKVLVPTYYALGDTRTPVMASFLSVLVNLAGNLLLMRVLGHVGLALSTSLTMLFNFAQLSFYLRRKLGRLDGKHMMRTALRVGLASAAMAAIIRGIVWATEGFWRMHSWQCATIVFGGTALGALLTWMFYRLFRVDELADLEDAMAGFGRKLGIGRRA
jgi:putative peptidoglycan lipid II flippase